MMTEFTYHSVWELGKGVTTSHRYPLVAEQGTRFSVIRPRLGGKVKVSVFAPYQRSYELSMAQLDQSVNVVLPVRPVEFQIRELATGKIYSRKWNGGGGAFVEYDPEDDRHLVDYDTAGSPRTTISNMIRLGVTTPEPVYEIINRDTRRGVITQYPISQVWWDNILRLSRLRISSKTLRPRLITAINSMPFGDIEWNHVAFLGKPKEAPKKERKQIKLALGEHGLDFQLVSDVMLLRDNYDAVMLRMLYPETKVIDL